MQQIIVSTDSSIALRPLLESAIQTELRMLAVGIERTRDRIEGFERQYEMDSHEFEALLHSGGIQENIELIEWSGEIETLRRLESKYNALQKAQLL